MASLNSKENEGNDPAKLPLPSVKIFLLPLLGAG